MPHPEALRHPAVPHSGPDATLESHRIVFAAERARLTGAVVALG